MQPCIIIFLSNLGNSGLPLQNTTVFVDFSKDRMSGKVSKLHLSIKSSGNTH